MIEIIELGLRIKPPIPHYLTSLCHQVITSVFAIFFWLFLGDCHKNEI